MAWMLETDKENSFRLINPIFRQYHSKFGIQAQNSLKLTN